MSTVQRKPESRSARKPPVTSEILDRQPPRNLEAEKAVLGSILLLPQVCDDVALIVRVEDFYDDANRLLYQHLSQMHDAGKRIDMTLLVERLRTAGDYEAIGGAAYLAEVGRSAPTASHAVHYAEIVRDKAMLRALIESSTEILRNAYDESNETREQVNRAEQSIFEILDKRHASQVLSANELIAEALARIDLREKGEHKVAGVDTGFPELDNLTGGLHDSELNIIAARPSMGKTAFALNVAEYVSCHLRVPTLFISLEMSAIELADRLLCAHAADRRATAAHRPHLGGRPAKDHRIVQRDQPGAAVRGRQPQPHCNGNCRGRPAAEAKAQSRFDCGRLPATDRAR